MSRYEKINYDELEMLAEVGGLDAGNDLLPVMTKNMICRSIRISIKLSKAVCPVPKSVNKTCTGVTPIN
jgi:hypothetical protein